MSLHPKTQDIVAKKNLMASDTSTRFNVIEPNTRLERPSCGLNSQMKSIWKGSIAFGLVNIPVRLYSATESQSLASHMLHKKDLSRIRFQRVAESTGKEVPAEEIVKG